MNNFRLSFLHLADAATIDRLGKISVFGIFERVFLDKVPGKFLKFSVVGNVKFSDVRKKAVKVEIKIFDKKGKELKMKPKSSFAFSVPEEKAGKSGSLGFIADIGNLKLENFGRYTVAVCVNGKKLGTTKLTVEKKK